MAIHFDKKMLQAYLDAEYILNESDDIFQIGTLHINEEGLFVELGFSSYAWITAWNPHSQELSSTDNLVRNKNLEHEMKPYTYFAGTSRSPDGTWEEKGYWVGNMKLGDLEKIGRKFGQNAIVHARLGNALKLIVL